MTPLRQRMTEDMRVRNLAQNTQMSSHVQQVSLFARHFKQTLRNSWGLKIFAATRW